MTERYNKIKQDLRQARSDQNSFLVTLLSTLVGEVDRDANKNQSDEFVVRTVRKFVESANECIKYKGGTYAAGLAQSEIDALTGYLPVLESPEATAQFVKSYKESNPTAKIGDLQSAAAKSGRKFDRSMLSRLFNQI